MITVGINFICESFSWNIVAFKFLSLSSEEA